MFLEARVFGITSVEVASMFRMAQLATDGQPTRDPRGFRERSGNGLVRVRGSFKGSEDRWRDSRLVPGRVLRSRLVTADLGRDESPSQIAPDVLYDESQSVLGVPDDIIGKYLSFQSGFPLGEILPGKVINGLYSSPIL